jgi:hypothetical protein
LDEDLIYVYNDVTDHRLIFVNTQNKIRYEVDVTEFRKQGFQTENVDVVSLDYHFDTPNQPIVVS